MLFARLRGTLMSERGPGIGKHRLEALTDGVMAIAMTLLVLEIKVPDLPRKAPTEELLAHLGAHLPTFASFVLSFVMLGVFWLRHHQLHHWIKRVDGMLLALNLTFLAGVSFFPFVAAFFGRFSTNALAQTLYMGDAALLVTTMTLQWAWARRRDLLVPELDTTQAALILRRTLAGNLAIVCFFGMAVLRFLD